MIDRQFAETVSYCPIFFWGQDLSIGYYGDDPHIKTVFSYP